MRALPVLSSVLILLVVALAESLAAPPPPQRRAQLGDRLQLFAGEEANSVEEAKLKKRAGSGWSSSCSFGYGIPAYGCRTDQLAAEAQRAREESQYFRQFLNSPRNPGRKRRAAMPPFKLPEVDE